MKLSFLLLNLLVALNCFGAATNYYPVAGNPLGSSPRITVFPSGSGGSGGGGLPVGAGTNIIVITNAGSSIVNATVSQGMVTSGDNNVSNKVIGLLLTNDWINANLAWGIESGANIDNSEAFLNMRTWLRSNEFAKIKLTNGFYRLTNANWLRGVRNVVIDGGGSWITNINTNVTFNFDASALGLNNGYVAGNTNDVSFSAPNITNSPIGFVEQGMTNLVLLNEQDTNRFFPGCRILIAAYHQESGGSPQNYRYNEIAEVLSVEGGGVLNLIKPVRNRYQTNLWTSHATYTPNAFTIPLDRPDQYTLADNVIIRNLKLGHSTKVLSELVQRSLWTTGVRNLLIENCDIGYFVPTESERVIVRNSRIFRIEGDKQVQYVRFENCDIGITTSFTGVDRAEFINCRFWGPGAYFDCAAKSTLIRGCEFYLSEDGQGSGVVLMNSDRTPVHRFIVEDNTFFIPTNAPFNALVSAGGSRTITNSSEAAANEIRMAWSDDVTNVMMRIWRSIDVGTKLFSSTRSDNVAAVTNIFFDYATSNIVVQANFPSAPTNGELFKYAVVQNISIKNNTVIPEGNTFTNWVYQENSFQTVRIEQDDADYVESQDGVATDLTVNSSLTGSGIANGSLRFEGANTLYLDLSKSSLSQNVGIRLQHGTNEIGGLRSSISPYPTNTMVLDVRNGYNLRLGGAVNPVVIAASSGDILQLYDGANTEVRFNRDGRMVMRTNSTTPTVNSGEGALVARPDRKLYWRDDLGVETDLTASGTGTNTLYSTNNITVGSAGSFELTNGNNTTVQATLDGGKVIYTVNAAGGSGTNGLFFTNNVVAGSFGSLEVTNGSNTTVSAIVDSGKVIFQVHATSSGGAGTNNVVQTNNVTVATGISTFDFTNGLNTVVNGISSNGKVIISFDVPDMIVGPASSTDNGVVRWDGTTGLLVQDTPYVTISDTATIITTNNVIATNGFHAAGSGDGIVSLTTSGGVTNAELSSANGGTIRVTNNIAAFQTVITNWINGQRYTNTVAGGFDAQRATVYGLISCNGIAGGLGQVSLYVEHGTETTNVTTAATFGDITNKIPISLRLSPGDYFYFTNESTGSATATILSGSWIGE